MLHNESCSEQEPGSVLPLRSYVTLGSLILSESESRSVVSNTLQPYGIAHGILQARILECVAAPFSRGSSQPRD